ncbi:hypothetical protein RFI_19050, partial [Reticulomyxa filosa]
TVKQQETQEKLVKKFVGVESSVVSTTNVIVPSNEKTSNASQDANPKEAKEVHKSETEEKVADTTDTKQNRDKVLNCFWIPDVSFALFIHCLFFFKKYKN